MKQLENAIKAIDLISNLNNDEELISQLKEIAEQRKVQIENFIDDINKINVIYEEVNPKKENEEI